jgi:hypothetical protein
MTGLSVIGRPAKACTPAVLLTSGPGRSTKSSALVSTVAFVAGGALLIWSAAIHLDLWITGYKDIPVIGDLFMAQFTGGLVVGLLVVSVRQLWVALLGAGFAIGTMGGFLVSVTAGLFGFRDSWDAPFAKQAFTIEFAALGVVLMAGVLCAIASRLFWRSTRLAR